MKRTADKSGLSKIDTFFVKRPKPSQISSNLDVTTDPQPANPLPSILEGPVEDSNCSAGHSYDIADYIGKPTDDLTKKMLLTNHWKPSKTDTFPYSLHTKCGKQVKRYVGNQHLDNYPWLVLSQKEKGLYCVYCVLFSSGEFGGNQASTPLNYFVKKPLTTFAKLTGKDGHLECHSKNRYHKDAVDDGQDFLCNYSQNTNILNMISAHRSQQAKENRAKLRSIADTLIFCGRQNIALRGHRDDGRIDERTIEERNEGNFRALLRLRMDAGDNVLSKHLKETASNALYTSKTVQNEIINCCKDEIQHSIIERVKKAGMYSVIFDETTDASHTSQVSLSYRYVYEKLIREDFFCFVDAYGAIRDEDVDGHSGEQRLTGVALGHIVQDIMESTSLDMSQCVGVGTDNCSVMASDDVGAIATLKQKAPYAKRCPCFNHSLNNSLGKTSAVVACRNAVGTMKEVIQFANSSGKRTKVFQAKLGSSFKGLCETRWCERHDGVLQFRTTLLKITDAFEDIEKWSDRKAASKAFCLKSALHNSQFLVSVIVLSDILGITRQLSVILQAENLDLQGASDALQDVLAILENRRQNAEDHFKCLFEEVQTLAQDLDVEISFPRTTKRQQHRNNIASQDPEQYYLRSIYIPALDHVIADLKDRLPEETLECFGLSVFVPKNMNDYTQDVVTATSLSQTYKSFLNVPEGTETLRMRHEYEAWVQKWNKEKIRGNSLPATAIETLNMCNQDQFPLIWKMLQLLSTLPVSNATSERSFSTLRRLKTWLRTKMTEDRLTGLALLNVHRDVPVEIDHIIERFAKQKARRLNFII